MLKTNLTTYITIFISPLKCKKNFRSYTCHSQTHSSPPQCTSAKTRARGGVKQPGENDATPASKEKKKNRIPRACVSPLRLSPKTAMSRPRRRAPGTSIAPRSSYIYRRAPRRDRSPAPRGAKRVSLFYILTIFLASSLPRARARMLMMTFSRLLICMASAIFRRAAEAAREIAARYGSRS